jgi:hypothetical protein
LTSAVPRARAPKSIWLTGLVALLVSLIPSPVSGADLDAGGDAGGSRYRFRRTERCLMRKINRARSRYGLSRLDRDKQLGYVARRHARRMASSQAVYHDDGVGWKVTRWRRIAQNSGAGAHCRSLARAFFNSSSHRANILGPYRFFGIGTKWCGGRLYAQQLFESRRDPGNVYHYP